MNTRPNAGAPPPGDGQSPLSLLVNAADSRDASQAQRDAGGGFPGQSLAETLRLRGLGGEAPAGPSFEEQLLLQQQQQLYGAPAPGAFLSQLRDQNILAQLGGAASASQSHQQQQQAQLASLLGLGGAGASVGAPGQGAAADIRSALAAAQLRQQQPQQPQLSHADILALSRTGALSGASGLLTGVGQPAPASMNPLGAPVAGPAPTGLASELESLQRLEEIERRQRLMTTGASPLIQNAAAAASAAAAARDSAAAAANRGPVIRDERVPGGHIPRPTMDTSQNSTKKERVAHPPEEQAVAVPGGVPSVPGIPGIDNVPKDELEKTPGSVIVPCRARGMPMDHNFKTAYFVIPENVKHGEELICSYFACRNAGIKFRYCSHCKVPVAKRNFRKRHKHGGEDVAPIHGDGDDSDGAEEPPVGGKRGIPAQITAKRSNMDADALSSNSAESNDKDEIAQGLVRSSIRTLEVKSEPQNHIAVPSMHTGEDSKIDPERMERWASLLGRRPATKEGDMMSAWLMEVLAVSDLDTPLKAPEDMDMKPKAEGAESAAQVATLAAAAEKVAAAAASAGADVKKPAKEVVAAAAAAVVKKKRPAELMQGDYPAAPSSGPEFASGSFAAWKERKKQKKQAKINPTQEAEV